MAKNNTMKQDQHPETTFIIFWIWAFLFYGIVITEILQLSLKSIGEPKIMMILGTGFLLLVFTAIFLSIVVDNFTNKYFSKLETIVYIGALITTVIFYFALRNNANLIL